MRLKGAKRITENSEKAGATGQSRMGSQDLPINGSSKIGVIKLGISK